MSTKNILMCQPDYFEVAYEINDWMHIDNPVDVHLAKQQWQKLYSTYLSLGYKVELIEPGLGLPDMVFTANGALIINGRVFSTHYGDFAKPRQPETPLFEQWFRDHGYTEIYTPKHDSEGEGDILYADDTIFAGYGQNRSSIESHAELAAFFSKKVVSLKLLDPRFYHLDTAMCPLGNSTVMYFPGAFDANGKAALKKHFSTLIEANEADAAGFGLNAVSDGKNVILSDAATGLHDALRSHGLSPIPIDMTEFRKSGGAVKCCSLELRPAANDKG